MLGDTLYKTSKDRILCPMIGTAKAQRVMEACHEDVCGGISSTAQKVLAAGYFWPNMHKDIQEWCTTYHTYQAFGRRELKRAPLHPIIALGPFEKWGLDFVGPLPRSHHGKCYILVAIDYVTRWAEAKAVVSCNAKSVVNFLIENIRTRFGCPLEIVTNHGPAFRAEILELLLSNLSVSTGLHQPIILNVLVVWRKQMAYYVVSLLK